MADSSDNRSEPPYDDDDGQSQENEVLRTSRLAKSLKEKAAEKAGGIGWKTAAGIGVGSAALLAALLYAKGGKK